MRRASVKWYLNATSVAHWLIAPMIIVTAFRIFHVFSNSLFVQCSSLKILQMKTLFRYLLSIFYVAAGAYHFKNPKFYVKIMPPFMPFKLELVYLSGVAEIVFGGMALFPQTQEIAGWLIVLMLIVFFIVHFYMVCPHIFISKNPNPLFPENIILNLFLEP